MASSTSDGETHDDEIRLRRENDWWIAMDVVTGVTTQGRTREDALDNLDEAVALDNDEIGREPTDEELREFGIDPAENGSATRTRCPTATPPDPRRST